MSDLQKLLDQPQIGAFVENKKQIKDTSTTWMSFGDPQKIKFFLDQIRTDEEMALVVMTVKSFSEPLTFSDSQVKSLARATKTLPLLKKYLAVIYVELTVGLAKKCNRSLLEGRIHRSEAEFLGAFDLTSQLYNWDEEIALLHPFIKNTWPGPADWPWAAKTVWIEGLEHWLLIADQYLRNREVILKDTDSFKKQLTQRLTQDELVLSLLKDFQLTKEQLIAICGAFDDAQLLSLMPLIKEEVPSLFTERKPKVIVTDQALVWLENWGGPHASRGWDVRVSRSIIHALFAGKYYRKALPYYYEYQDYEGGQTYHYQQHQLQTINKVTIENGKIQVSVRNVQENDLNITLSGGSLIGGQVRDQLIIDKVAKDLAATQLSHGNTNFIPINGPQGSGLATYPYAIVSKKIKNHYYLAVVKVIDMEHYVDYNTPNGQQAIGCQYQVSIFRYNFQDNQCIEIYNKTSDRNEHFQTHLDIVIAKQSAGNKLFFALEPELYGDDKIIGVKLRLRTGQESWKDLKFETKL